MMQLIRYFEKEKVHYTCIATIYIDSVMKMNKKYYPQVYLEECRYQIKKKETQKRIRSRRV